MLVFTILFLLHKARNNIHKSYKGGEFFCQKDATFIDDLFQGVALKSLVQFITWMAEPDEEEPASAST